MSKYIGTDKLKQMVEHEMDMQDTYLPAHFFDIVDDMPAADVVEVVRCKDCKYLDYVDEHEKWCMGRGYPATMVKDDGYCEIGKRKEES